MVNIIGKLRNIHQSCKKWNVVTWLMYDKTFKIVLRKVILVRELKICMELFYLEENASF